MENRDIENENQQLSLQTLFLEVKNNVLLIVIITLLFALLGGIYARFFVKTKYTSKASFIVNVSMEDSKVTETTAYSYAISLTNSLAPFIKTANVGDVAKDLYFEATGETISSGAITGSLSVSTTEKNFIISITCTSTNPNADKILQAAMDATEQVANSLTDKSENHNHTVMYNKFLPYESPSKPTSDASNKLYKYILIFMLIGLVVSFVIIVLKILFNDTYKTKEDLERDIPVEVLALIDDLTHTKEGK